MNVQYVQVWPGVTRYGIMQGTRDEFLNSKEWLFLTTVDNAEFFREEKTLEQAIADNPKGLLLFSKVNHFYVDGEVQISEDITWIEDGKVLQCETI